MSTKYSLIHLFKETIGVYVRMEWEELVVALRSNLSFNLFFCQLNVIFYKEEFRACADIQISNSASTEAKKTKKGSFWNQRNNKNSIERPYKRRKDDSDFSLKSSKPDSYRYSLKGKNSYSFFSFDISSDPDGDVNTVPVASGKTMKEKRVFNKNR